MSNDTKDHDPRTEADPAGDRGVEAPGDSPSLEDQLAEAKDQYLRLAAEMRNMQHRAQRERAETERYATAEFARDLLPAIDDLERALQAATADESDTSFAEGVRIARDHFLRILASQGVKRIEAVGQPFDADLHEALMQQPSDEYPSGVVLQELGVGYTMHDRVLRTAKVIVSSGPSNAAK